LLPLITLIKTLGNLGGVDNPQLPANEEDSTRVTKIIDLTEGDNGTWSCKISRVFSYGEVHSAFPTIVLGIQKEPQFQ